MRILPGVDRYMGVVFSEVQRWLYSSMRVLSMTNSTAGLVVAHIIDYAT